MDERAERIVLMADDDEDDCVVAKAAFRKCGAKGALCFVFDGVELMDYLQKCEIQDKECNPLPDLIFLDLNMPRKDGREVLKEIRSMEAFTHIPIVILTTSKSMRDMDFCLLNGANSFIVKPDEFDKWVGIMEYFDQRWVPMSAAHEGCRDFDSQGF